VKREYIILNNFGITISLMLILIIPATGLPGVKQIPSTNEGEPVKTEEERTTSGKVTLVLWYYPREKERSSGAGYDFETGKKIAIDSQMATGPNIGNYSDIDVFPHSLGVCYIYAAPNRINDYAFFYSLVDGEEDKADIVLTTRRGEKYDLEFELKYLSESKDNYSIRSWVTFSLDIRYELKGE